MHSFKDKEGREWRLSLNFRTLERLRDEGIDLTDPKTVLALGDDPYRLGMTLWTLAQSQADTAGVSPDAFAEATADGDVIEAAVVALVEELVSFTRPARRDALRKAMAAKRALEERTLATAVEMMESEAMTQRMDEVTSKLRTEFASSLSVTNSPESLE